MTVDEMKDFLILDVKRMFKNDKLGKMTIEMIKQADNRKIRLLYKTLYCLEGK